MKFLQGKEFNGRGEKILTSIIRMSKWMQIPAIVEGVETIEQIDFLKCIGCDYAQGFYYAKPMPIREYEAYVERSKRSASPIPTEENFYLVNELWNTRSKISRFFDLIHVPMAVFEYHNKKYDLLRANAEFDRLFGVDGGNDAYIKEKTKKLISRKNSCAGISDNNIHRSVPPVSSFFFKERRIY